VDFHVESIEVLEELLHPFDHDSVVVPLAIECIE